MDKLKLLKDANKKLNQLFDEFADENNLNNAERTYMKTNIQKAYMNKKLAYFIEERFSHINNYLTFAFDNAEKQIYGLNSNKKSLKLLYYKNIKRSYIYGKNQ